MILTGYDYALLKENLFKLNFQKARITLIWIDFEKMVNDFAVNVAVHNGHRRVYDNFMFLQF